MTDEEARLQAWLRRAPQWAREAFYNDATVNRVMKRCAAANDGIYEMLWSLSGALYGAKNCWEATALDMARRNPSPSIITGQI